VGGHAFVGEHAFVLHELDRPTDKAEEKNTPVRNVLVSSAHRHHLYTVNTYCFANLLDHLLLRSSYPEDAQSAELTLSIDLEGVTLHRARLPPSKTGLLLRQRGGLDALLPHAALWGGAARALLPSFAHRQQANPQQQGEAEGGGVSPSSLISWAMSPSRRMDQGGTRQSRGVRGWGMHCGARGSACRSMLMSTPPATTRACLWSQPQQGQWAGSCRAC
jgi:hypothetical protein